MWMNNHESSVVKHGSSAVDQTSDWSPHVSPNVRCPHKDHYNEPQTGKNRAAAPSAGNGSNKEKCKKNISVICQNKKGKNHLFTSRTGFEHVIKLLNIYIQNHLLLSMNHFELCVKKCFNILPATDIMMWSLVGRQINDLSLKSVKRSPLISALFHIFDWW